MKALRTWLLALFLMGCVLATPALAADTVASGTCGAEGSNLTWALDSEGVLTISGTGAMADFTAAPWYSNEDSIKTVAIGSGVTNIGASAFYDCRKLTSVSISDSVTSIGNSAFGNCSSLTGIIIPNGVTKIGGSAFRNCSSLTSVTIPNGLTNVSDRVFYGCSSLSSITIPDSVVSIEEFAFYNCSSLSSLTLGHGVTSIGRQTFSDCKNLADVYFTDMDAWCRIAFEDSYATPGYYAGNFYLNGEKVVSVAVPQDVTALNYTFEGFRDLVQVTLPDGLTSISGYAFNNCSSLASITIPDSVTSIGSYAFYNCSSLEDVNITDMDAWCRITFANYLSTPMRFAKNIYLNGEKITSVTVPQGITAVQSWAFYGFPDLATVTIPDSVTGIEREAFASCRSLANITIPDSVTSIGVNAFEKCTSLQSITVGSGVTSINGSSTYSSPFYGCNNLESVYITDMAAWCGITFASNAANPLYYAKNLYLNGAKVETLEIPEGVQVIAKNAFINATCIQGVAIPKSLAGVAANAFTGCENIAKVYYAGSETEWKDLAISAGNDPLTNAEIFYNATADDYYCRITVKISDGGRIFVDRNMAAEGETVTITTAPYAGYELSALYVDGTAIEGNTFTVTGNHEVSALFTKLPVTGGTQDYRLEGITVQTAEGVKLQELTAGKLLVSVSVRHLQGTEGATILLAQYDAQGRYQGLLWLTLDEMPLDMALKVTLPVDNSDGKIVHLKAFVVDSLLSAVPVGSAVSFGDV